MKSHLWQVDIEDYAPLIGEEAAERILHKAHRLRGLRVLHVSSAPTGGSGCDPGPEFRRRKACGACVSYGSDGSIEIVFAVSGPARNNVIGAARTLPRDLGLP